MSALREVALTEISLELFERQEGSTAVDVDDPLVVLEDAGSCLSRHPGLLCAELRQDGGPPAAVAVVGRRWGGSEAMVWVMGGWGFGLGGAAARGGVPVGQSIRPSASAALAFLTFLLCNGSL